MARSSLLDRLPVTPPVLMRRLAVAAVVAQIGIAVTGSVVRVTGSGLGCPTWPQCNPGSIVPVAHPELLPLHQWVEFGNRLLAVVVVLVSGACLLAALGARPRRTRLVWLAAAMPLGVVAQAVIGGITVLVGLAWWSVMPHFLASIVLVWLAVELVAEARDGGPTTRVVPRHVRGLVITSTVVLGALLVAGTLVTSAGPHAGDAATPRLDIGVPTLAQLHADLLFAYLGMVVGLGFALWATKAPARLRRRYWWLVGVVLAQGALGGIQYGLGVPEALVSLHVLGAALVTAAAAAVWTATRAPVPADDRVTGDVPPESAPPPAAVDGTPGTDGAPVHASAGRPES
ncbi:heme A synthase [Pseudonocardia sp. N23]|uniref:COX15/CtaA family protein n=1 Tax=Pseudonocardia sp. N23 TaxID=1987376 RepID=UPI000C037F5B|nr:COX15/CtaA family protein [Pseudonocardia sp. N23]GAY12490.1 cytochrome oxidase assembly protein [Pseudonocardia sp. N23]